MNEFNCAKCGKFISYKQFENGQAITEVIGPATPWEDEDIYYEHLECNEVKNESIRT